MPYTEWTLYLSHSVCSSQEKLAVDTGLDRHRRHQSYSVIAPSTRSSSLSWDHFEVISCVDHTYGHSSTQENRLKPNTKLQMVPPRTRRACGQRGYGEAVMVTVPIQSVSTGGFSCNHARHVQNYNLLS